MKIKMNFGIVKTVILAVLLAGVLAVIALDIAILAGVEGIVLTSPAVPAVSMTAAIIVGIACLLLLVNSHYKFNDNNFSIVLGFFAEKVAYDEIVIFKQNIETSELFVVVNDISKQDIKTQIALRINVAPAKTDTFMAEIRKRVPDITVEMFTPPKKKKKGE